MESPLDRGHVRVSQLIVGPYLRHGSGRRHAISLAAATVLVLVALSLAVWRLYHPPVSPRFEIRMNAGNIFLNQGWYGKAEQSYHQALTLDGRNIHARWALMKARLHLNGDAEYVEEQVRRMLQETPADPHLHVLLGALVELRGEYSEAEDHYQKAIRLDHGVATAWYGLGRYFIYLQEWGAAQQALEHAVRLAPGKRCYMNRLVDVYYRQRNHEAAANVLRQLIGDDPRVFLPHYRLASILRLAGKYDDALKVLEDVARRSLDRGLASRPVNQDAWYFVEGEDTVVLHDREAKRAYETLSLSLTRQIVEEGDGGGGKHTEADGSGYLDSDALRLIGLEMDRLVRERPELANVVHEFAMSRKLLGWMSQARR